MTVGERIKNRRTQLKLSAEDLGKRIGKNRATVYRYESNDIENMPYDVIVPLAKALNVSPAYLMGWDDTSHENLSTNYFYFPIGISAGTPVEVEGITEHETISIPDPIMGKWAGQSDVFVMKVNGESMNKVIPDGSFIAVKKTDVNNLKSGDIVVYSDGNDYSVKRFYQSEDQLIFRPDSNDLRFTDYTSDVNNTDLKIYGKVVVYIVELN